MGFWASNGAPNFEYTYLMNQGFPKNFQLWCYAGFLIAFGVKLPIVPLHTWLLMLMVKQLHQFTCCCGYSSQDGWICTPAIQL